MWVFGVGALCFWVLGWLLSLLLLVAGKILLHLIFRGFIFYILTSFVVGWSLCSVVG
jgi:hypothetical protein